MSKRFCWRDVNLPPPQPLREAVLVGVFGICADGSLTPSSDEVASITEEQARELLSTLCDLRHLRRCLGRKLNPHTKRPVQVRQVWERIENSMRQGIKNLERNYSESLDAYGSAFGAEAAEELNNFVQRLLERPEFTLEPIEVQRSLF